VPEIGAAALAPLTLKGVLQAAAFIAFLLQAPLCKKTKEKSEKKFKTRAVGKYKKNYQERLFI
jgi:hypothetical protein